MRFYTAVAGAVKRFDPDVRVGLAGFTGGFVNDWIATGVDDDDALGGWAGVVSHVVTTGVAVDFVSWHTYSDSWAPIIDTAAGVRERLDQLGLTAAEQHLTEWNYDPVLSDADGEYTFKQARRRSSHERYLASSAVANGVPGAAYLFGTLAALQDTAIDLAHVYTGTSMAFGLFDASGHPHPKFSGLEAFAEFLDPDVTRVAVSDTGDHTQALAVRTSSGLRVGVARLDGEPGPLVIQVPDVLLAEASVAVRTLTDDGWQTATAQVDAMTGRMAVALAATGLALIEVTV